MTHRGQARPARRGERGLSLLIVAITSVVMLIIVAIVADLGYAKARKRDLQATADLAALAAAQELDGRPDQVRRATARAMSWVGKNQPRVTPSSWVGCTDPQALNNRPLAASGNTCISFDSATTPTKVRVRLPAESQPRFFGSITGNGSPVVKVAAIAARTPTAGSGGDCGLCARDWIQWAGVQDITVVGGGIVHTTQLTANWSTGSTVAPCPISAVTNASSNATCPGTGSQPMKPVSTTPPDPFATLPAPPTGIAPCQVGGQACNVNSSNAATLLVPNRVFTQSVDLSNINLTLQPGNYYFAGPLRLNGGVTLAGTGVTLFFVCANSNQPSQPCPGGGMGTFEASGDNNTLDLTAPSTGPYAGMAIYFDRANSQGTAPKFSGNASRYTIVGSIYAYGGKFTGSGNRVIDITGQVYTQWWEDNGGGHTTIRYGGGSSSGGSGSIRLEE